MNASLRVAYESMVLLENDGILPLKSSAKIALIGPYSKTRNLIGPWTWHGRRDLHQTLEETLKEHLIYVNEEEDFSKYTKADLAKLQEADLVILALGEHDRQSGEAHSRSSIDLPNNQNALFKMAKDLGLKTVTLLFNGRPLLLNQVQKSNALLECWFLGSESSKAIKDILFGDVNPSGKLPISFPRNVGQIPVYYNHLNTGRPYLGPNDHNEYVSKYLDVENTPLYPFGYGLSYSKFDYSNLTISSSKISPFEPLIVTISITNNSAFSGSEIVQLYIRDHVARISRPVMELKQFKKEHFNPFETKEITFKVTLKDLQYFTETGETVYDLGKFTVMAGASSETYLQQEFELN